MKNISRARDCTENATLSQPRREPLRQMLLGALIIK